jgi:hypothetical protein
VSIILNDLDHMCCGPRRQVGDAVRMDIHNYRGQLYEERHVGGVSIATQEITGRIKEIWWRPAIMREVNEILRTRDGYGPGIQVESTDDDEPGSSDSWAFEFIVDTEDPLPEPR